MDRIELLKQTSVAMHVYRDFNQEADRLSQEGISDAPGIIFYRFRSDDAVLDEGEIAFS